MHVTRHSRNLSNDLDYRKLDAEAQKFVGCAVVDTSKASAIDNVQELRPFYLSAAEIQLQGAVDVLKDGAGACEGGKVPSELRGKHGQPILEHLAETPATLQSVVRPKLIAKIKDADSESNLFLSCMCFVSKC